MCASVSAEQAKPAVFAAVLVSDAAVFAVAVFAAAAAALALLSAAVVSSFLAAYAHALPPSNLQSTAHLSTAHSVEERRCV